MAEEPEGGIEAAQAVPVLDIRWAEPATAIADQIIGFAAVNGSARITLGEIVYAPGGVLPSVRPTVNLCITGAALEMLGAQLLNIAEQMKAQENAPA